MRLKSKWIILFGVLIVVLGLGLFACTQISIFNLEKQSASILSKAKEILPQKTVGTVDEFYLKSMAAVEINGEDIIGIIDSDDLDMSLPLGFRWEKNSISYPKRFSGSVYDNSLVVGGYYCEGQFECLTRADIGQGITVTDMTGAQFRYRITDIKRKKSASADFLKDDNYDLTLFVRNPMSSEYIIVRCILQ